MQLVDLHPLVVAQLDIHGGPLKLVWVREVFGRLLPSHAGFKELPVVLGLLVKLESQILDGVVSRVNLVGHGLHLEPALSLIVRQLTLLLFNLTSMLMEERGYTLGQLILCVLWVPSLSHDISDGSYVAI